MRVHLGARYVEVVMRVHLGARYVEVVMKVRTLSWS
jgi:hypothetical protein